MSSKNFRLKVFLSYLSLYFLPTYRMTLALFLSLFLYTYSIASLLLSISLFSLLRMTISLSLFLMHYLPIHLSIDIKISLFLSMSFKSLSLYAPNYLIRDFVYLCFSLTVSNLLSVFLFIKNVSSTTSHKKSLFVFPSLSEFKKILSSTFTYELIFIKKNYEW